MEQIGKIYTQTKNEEKLFRALSICLDALTKAVTIISLQNGASIQLSPDIGEYLFKANTMPELPVVQEETQVSEGRGVYISKRVYEDAYWRITVYFNENGAEIKRDSKKL